MSMRTWTRKMAHEKAKALGIKKPNKERTNPINGRKMPSWFAMNWRQIAAYQLPKTKKRRKANESVSA